MKIDRLSRHAPGPTIAGMEKRNLKTPFWRNAAASLPAAVRARHALDLERAERWELALGRAVEAVARAISHLKNAARGRTYATSE